MLQAASRYQPRALFRTYLYAIAFQILRAHRRKSSFRAMFFVTGSSDHEPAVENTMDRDLLLRNAVARLDSRDREILLLREFEQLSYAEIADLLNLPINTVRSRLFRARTALHEILTAPAADSANHLAASEERI